MNLPEVWEQHLEDSRSILRTFTVTVCAMFFGALCAGGFSTTLRLTGLLLLVLTGLFFAWVVVDAALSFLRSERGSTDHSGSMAFFGVYLLAVWWASGWVPVAASVGAMLCGCMLVALIETEGWCQPGDMNRRVVLTVAKAASAVSRVRAERLTGLILVLASVIWAALALGMRSAVLIAVVSAAMAVGYWLLHKHTVVRIRIAHGTLQRLQRLLRLGPSEQRLVWDIVDLRSVLCLVACTALVWVMHGWRPVLQYANVMFAVRYFTRLFNLDCIHLKHWAGTASMWLRQCDREMCYYLVIGSWYWAHMVGIWMHSGFMSVLYLANIVAVMVWASEFFE